MGLWRSRPDQETSINVTVQLRETSASELAVCLALVCKGSVWPTWLLGNSLYLFKGMGLNLSGARRLSREKQCFANSFFTINIFFKSRYNVSQMILSSVTRDSAHLFQQIFDKKLKREEKGQTSWVSRAFAWGVIGLLFEPHHCLVMCMWKRLVQLPCRPQRGWQVLHLRWNSGMCNTYTPTENKYGYPLWLWNPEHISPGIQNRDITGITKQTYVLQNYF